jgi:hypothetical protein
LNNLRIDGRIDPSKDFHGGSATGDNGFFTHNDAPRDVQCLWDKEFSRDVSLANVFIDRDCDWIVGIRLHGSWTAEALDKRIAHPWRFSNSD